MLMTLPLTLLRSPISRSFSSRVEKSRNGTRWVLSFTRYPPCFESFVSFVHCHDDFSNLRVAQHVGVSVGDLLEWKGSIEYRLERAGAECAEQVGRETLTAYQRFLERTGPERNPDDTHALARDLIEIAIANLSGIAPDAYEAPLNR